MLRTATIATVVLGASLLPRAPLHAQQRADSLQLALESRIRADTATVGLYFTDLSRPDSVTINADLQFHAASTMKVAVMVQVFREIDAGRLRPDRPITVENSFVSLVGDTAYSLSAEDDSEKSLYREVGRQVTVERLVELMITQSSNLATNVLMRHVSAASIQATLAELGIDSMVVRRGVEDGPAFRAGLNNTTSARALGKLFAAIADGRAASPVSCGAMLEILWHQRFRTGIPAGLPRRTRVAHKTGTITALMHDGGVVYLNNRPRYVLVVLTRGLPQEADAARLIADLTRLVQNYLVPPPPPPPPRRFPAPRP